MAVREAVETIDDVGPAQPDRAPTYWRGGKECRWVCDRGSVAPKAGWNKESDWLNWVEVID